MDTNATTTNSVDINTYTPVFKTGTTVKGTKLMPDVEPRHRAVRGRHHRRPRARAGRQLHRDALGLRSRQAHALLPLRRQLVEGHLPREGWPEAVPVRGGLHRARARSIPTTRTRSTSRRPTIRATTPPNQRGKREIWRGTTCDNGATFMWTQVTARSTMDNIRPIVPKWDASHTALLWLNGTYTERADLRDEGRRPHRAELKRRALRSTTFRTRDARASRSPWRNPQRSLMPKTSLFDREK